MGNRTTIINTLASKYGAKTYLEIGVRDTDDNFNKILIDKKDGVDPNPIKSIEYKVTSDEFFLKYIGEKKYDIIFVDGLHTSEQVYIDIKNSIKHLNDGGFIVVHDCNPPTEFHARSYPEYLKKRGEWNGDVYKGFIKIKNELKDWKVFVVDCDFGCGILTKNKINIETTKYTNSLDNLSWGIFNKNRYSLLDLISYKTFIELINN
jgi:hypothetical protein